MLGLVLAATLTMQPAVAPPPVTVYVEIAGNPKVALVELDTQTLTVLPSGLPQEDGVRQTVPFAAHRLGRSLAVAVALPPVALGKTEYLTLVLQGGTMLRVPVGVPADAIPLM